MIRILFALLLMMQTAHAFVAERQLPDAAKEARARTLFKQTRCMVCAGESIAESNAELAIDMRAMIRMKIEQGLSDEDISNYLESRYGEEINLSPPIDKRTYALWAAPIMLLALGYYLMKPKR